MKTRSVRGIRRSEQTSLHELNITPLLDLVFVLLVIFIITTPQLTNSLEINLPSGKPPPTKALPAKERIVRITVTDLGQIWLDQQPVSLPTLKERLAQAKGGELELGVVVEGSGDVDYQKMVDVLDVLRQLEIDKVGLATEAAPTSAAGAR